jgi:small-conductance mechanosensitive channel
MSEYIINYSIKDPKVLGTLEVGISYDSDIDEARHMMIEIALNHPDLPKKVKGEGSEFLSRDDLVKVKLIELTDFAHKLRLYY